MMTQRAPIKESEIGKKIKELRLERRITLESLASKTGFTKGYLSKVEKSEKAPPVSTLDIISRVLNVTISSLLGEESYSSSLCLVKKEERALIAGEGAPFDYTYESVAHKFKNRMMEPFILILPVNPRKKKLYQHEGQEVLFVLEGTMRFRHGKQELMVEEGDCVYFDSGVPHFGESVGNRAARCFMVIYSPGRRWAPQQ